MNIKIIALIFLLSSKLFCQLAIINDHDGFTNVRRQSNAKSEIIGRLFQDEPFHYDPYEESDQWVEIVYTAEFKKMEASQRNFYRNELKWTNDTLYLDGFIHKSRLKYIDALPKLSNKRTNNGKGEVIIENDTITFSIKTSKFRKKEHKITKREGWESKIDGVYPMGVTGDTPKVEIRNIALKLNKIEIIIPKSDFRDLYEPNLNEINVYLGERGVIYIYMPMNSDGCGGYDAIWIIKNGKYLKRFVDNSLA